jgi:hypothetical protein
MTCQGRSRDVAPNAEETTAPNRCKRPMHKLVASPAERQSHLSSLYDEGYAQKLVRPRSHDSRSCTRS